jgi:hypothetical protein
MKETIGYPRPSRLSLSQKRSYSNENHIGTTFSHTRAESSQLFH